MGGIENRRDRKRGGQHVGKDVHQAVGRSMKSAKSASGKRKKDGPKKGSAKGKKGAL
jgi:hypothetical protein